MCCTASLQIAWQIAQPQQQVSDHPWAGTFHHVLLRKG